MTTALAPREELICTSVEWACRAPSLHNSQPWRFVYDSAGLHLYVDERRLLDTTDPTGRQAIISCGAALHHLRIALPHFGLAPTVRRFPDPADPSLLADITFDRVEDLDPRDAALFLAIEHRRTDRRPFRRPSEVALHDLDRAARRHGATMTLLGPEARDELARASRTSAALHRYDPAYRAELLWWSGHSRDDGIPRNLLPAAVDGPPAVEIARTFPAGTLEADGDEDQAALGVLSTCTDTPRDWLHVGEALSSVLLEATVLHLATCPLTHVTEVPASREIVRATTAVAGSPCRYPQVAIRFGGPRHPPLVGQTARRSVEDVYRVR
ncbi:hypothetical protein G4X40_10345 [Rhodococcus sp. D2-41]|uniref:Acg family FMN-binding oxidoreductase n=1 Tax=Speluncibacter jeojiensis TaxID=2710754 RepID=UPI00240EB644|nr:hypothetical protein [Rhodococcus sp. D2-41]MDG3010547.1 hypothetical protein [Rhodococcus sp. D2-41]